MLKILLIGLPVMLLCLAIQTALTGVSVQYALRRISVDALHLKTLGNIRLLMVVMLILMLGNLLQISIWGALFLWLGEFTEFYEAVYHSTVNYASLGYGDIVMSKSWKLLGPLEAVNGVLMCGMTAGVLMGILQAQIKQTLRQGQRLE
ncbi:MAG: potassium channel family protein [Thiobacillus sp.]